MSESVPKTNICILVAFNITTMIGMINFGLALANWNMFQDLFALRHNWTTEETLKWSIVLTTAMTLGLMIGALSSGFLMKKFSKWTLTMTMNLILIIGVGVTLIDTIEI